MSEDAEGPKLDRVREALKRGREEDPPGDEIVERVREQSGRFEDDDDE